MSSPLAQAPSRPGLVGPSEPLPGAKDRASDAGTALPPQARPVGHRTDTLKTGQQVTD